MFLVDEKGQKFRAQKCKSPRFKRGTWDFIRKVIEDKEAQFWLDFTWGFYFYFKYKEQWYKVRHTNRFTDEMIDDERFQKFKVETKMIKTKEKAIENKIG